jgi:hypothetical protein
MRTYRGNTDTKGKKSKTRGSEMGNAKRSVLHYTFTYEQDEKHILQKSFEIMKKTRAKNGYIC